MIIQTRSARPKGGLTGYNMITTIAEVKSTCFPTNRPQKYGATHGLRINPAYRIIDR